MKKLALVCLIMILASCTIWSQVKPGDTFGEKQGFDVQLPNGWMRFHPGVQGYMITKDGLSIQRITIAKYSLDKAFTKSEKTLTADMLVTDVMDYYIAELQQKNEGLTVEVEAKEPAIISGQEGFKVNVLLTAPDGLKYRLHSYGLLSRDGFYEISYEAPVIHYFSRDLPVFEKAKDSFRLISEKQ